MLASDEDFINAWKATGGRAAEVAKILGYTGIPNVYARRRAIEKKGLGARLTSAGDAGHSGRGDAGTVANDYLQRITLDGFTGTAVVFSDCHYWPGQGASIAHQALVEVAKELRPNLLIGNGDLFDGAKLSRFPRNGWEYQPKVKDELEEAKERLGEIRPGRARRIRTIGNHCIRFDRHLAMQAGDMEGIFGTRLADHLPAWEECVSVFVNGHTMIKHRFNGGIHAAYNNTLKAGTNIVTGHTHALEVKPWGDYRGRRYGVQTGAIADVDGPQFSYTEDAPTAWCSGFAVLTFDKDGRLLMPELCEVIEGVAYFRGQRVAGRRKVAA
jgi:hypothetical protein